MSTFKRQYASRSQHVCRLTCSTCSSLKLVSIDSRTPFLSIAPGVNPSALVEMVNRFGAPDFWRMPSLGPYRV